MRSQVKISALFFIIIGAVFLSSFSANAAGLFQKEGIIAELPIEEYVGSAACETCHKEKYENWSRTIMATFVRYREDTPGPLPGDWSDSPISEDNIFLIVGKKRRVAFVNNSWKVIPYDYHFKKRQWRKVKGWAKNNYDYRKRCGPCHTVALNPKTLKYKELNVGCESCHGPGKKHIEAQGAQKIKVPGRTDSEDVLHTCRKCHNDRKNHARSIKNFMGVFHSNDKVDKN